jgi:iron complex outermembrane receptor protein
VINREEREGRLARHLVRVAVATALAASLGTVSLTASGAEEGVQELEEVRITGSRIVRRDYEANSPIVTVDAEAFELQSGQNVESYLNSLPAYNPAASPTTMEDDIQPTAINSVGIATISLRGFGANRNLVLLDDKRAVPANAVMVTDLNSIPSAMLERVEIISGGASAVYGADAIGGVTNFILKKNFKGMQLDMQQGFTGAGDGEEFRISGLLGTDFAEGRGNITVAVEHYDRKTAYERNRSFYTDQWADPNQLSDDLFFYGSAGYNSATDRAPGTGNPGAVPPVPDFFNSPADATMRQLLGTPATSGFRGGGLNNNSGTHQYRFGPNGQVLSALFGDNTARWDELGLIDGRRIARVNNYDNSNSDASGAAIPGNTNLIQTLKYNDQEALASAPQKRFSFFTSANYDITDKLNFNTRVNFSQSRTHTRLYPTVPISGWDGRAPFDPAIDSPVNPAIDWTDPANVAAWQADPSNPAFLNPNFIPSGTMCTDIADCPVDGVGAEGLGSALASHPVTPEVAIMLLSRDDPDAGWMVELFPDESLGRRTTDNTNTYWQVEAALNYQLPFKDWTAELYGSIGEQNSRTYSKGNLSLQRWRAMLLQRDWGRNSNQQANSAVLGATNVNFGTVPVHCTSGFYDTLFAGEVQPSQDCLDAVYAQLQSHSSNRQDVLELNLQGGLFSLPAGEVRTAVGYAYRDNFSEYVPDILESNVSYLDQVVGKYPSSYLDVSQHVQDVYVELLVPVLRDLPLLNKLELELGARHSTYEHTASTDTFKALANIEINDALRLRGGFNRANRAPNLGELFLELQQIFTGTGGLFSDACSLRSNATYGAGGAAADPVDNGGGPTQLAPGQTTEGAQSTYLICQAQMGSLAAANFYSGDQGTTQFAPAGFANAWLQQVGSRDLKSEKADTWSAGFVFAGGGISDRPWVRGFTGSVDWWQVHIKDAIQPYSADYAGWLCYGQVTVTTLAEAQAYVGVNGSVGPGTAACSNVPREPTRGTALSKRVAFDNQATIETSGIDVAVNWSVNLQDIGVGAPGRFGINTQATFLDYYRTKASPISIDVPVDWKGSLGPNLVGTNPGAYKYRINTNLSYGVGRFNFNLGWRHLPGVWTANKAYENAVVANNARVAADPAAGTLLGYTKSDEIKTSSYSEFNLSGTFELNDTLSLRAGIDNLFDRNPPRIGGTTGVTQAELATFCGATPAPGCNPGVQRLGRSSLAASAGQFTGTKGYYDVMGRSFFFGFKASF